MKAINKIVLSFIAIAFFQTNLWSQQGAWKLNPGIFCCNSRWRFKKFN
jgi:hypothetical protein